MRERQISYRADLDYVGVYDKNDWFIGHVDKDKGLDGLIRNADKSGQIKLAQETMPLIERAIIYSEGGVRGPIDARAPYVIREVVYSSREEISSDKVEIEKGLRQHGGKPEHVYLDMKWDEFEERKRPKTIDVTERVSIEAVD